MGKWFNVSLPNDAHIGRVSLTVRDLDRSLLFYRDVLGFHEIAGSSAFAPGASADKKDPAPRTAMLGAGRRVLVELHENKDAVPKPRRSSGLYHFATLVPSRAALGRSLRRLAEKRWPLSGASDHLVSEALYLDDPDGLGIEIYRDRPRAEWPIRDGQLMMATDPLDLQSIVDDPGADAPWSGLHADTVIGHVHLHVPHLDAAEAFYCGRIGFDPTVRGYPGALFVAAGGYHHHLGLNTWTGIGAPPPPANAVGLRSFTIDSTELLPAEHRDESTGVTVLLSRT